VVTINVRAKRASNIVADPKNSGGVPKELEDGQEAEYKTEDQHGHPDSAPGFSRRIRKELDNNEKQNKVGGKLKQRFPCGDGSQR
jgi:hypothetical protein